MKTVMDTDVIGFAALSGDDNHPSLRRYARHPVRQRIAHGFTRELISAVLGTRCRGGAVYRSQTSISSAGEDRRRVIVTVEVVELVPRAARCGCIASLGRRQDRSGRRAIVSVRPARAAA